jgi:hypothetical protein
MPLSPKVRKMVKDAIKVNPCLSTGRLHKTTRFVNREKPKDNLLNFSAVSRNNHANSKETMSDSAET